MTLNTLALGVLLPGFGGTSVPAWLADALAGGLAGVCLFAENTPDLATTRALTDEVRRHAGERPVIVAADEEGGDVTRLEAATGLAAGRLHPDRLERSARRNRALADRPQLRLRSTPEEVQANVLEIGTRAARLSLITKGKLIVERPWVLLDLRRRIRWAAGRTSTAFGDTLLELLPDGEVMVPSGPAEARAAIIGERDCLVLTREPLADTEEGELLAAVLEAWPDAVVIHAGVAAAAPKADRLVCCHGVGRANARAVAGLLKGMG